jgi:N utilization substance protein B
VPDPRHQARVLALQALHHLDAQGDEGIAQLPRLLAGQSDVDSVRRRAQSLAEEAWQARTRHDAWIQQTAEHWDLSRISKVERSILRLALYELMDCHEPPAKVAINEAIELAKTFGGANSAEFVNGVLDAIWRAHSAESIKAVE